MLAMLGHATEYFVFVFLYRVHRLSTLGAARGSTRQAAEGKPQKKDAFLDECHCRWQWLLICRASPPTSRAVGVLRTHTHTECVVLGIQKYRVPRRSHCRELQRACKLQRTYVQSQGKLSRLALASSSKLRAARVVGVDGPQRGARVVQETRGHVSTPYAARKMSILAPFSHYSSACGFTCHFVSCPVALATRSEARKSRSNSPRPRLKGSSTPPKMSMSLSMSLSSTIANEPARCQARWLPLLCVDSKHVHCPVLTRVSLALWHRP